MGNPLSGSLPDIFLERVIDNSKKKLKDRNIEITFIKKYVDDIFAIAKRDDIETILETFNEVGDTLMVKIERENNRRLYHFLMFTLKDLTPVL